MRKAFTLIELLVVIAIIAILAAILFPVFAQAKMAAKKSADLSNTKQIGIALNLYLADSDDVLPPSNHRLDPAGLNEEHWSWMILPYMKNEQIFVSPADKIGGWAPTAWDPTTNNRGFGVPGIQTAYNKYNSENKRTLQVGRISYIANQALIGRKRSEDDQANVVSSTAIDGVSQTILVAPATESINCIMKSNEVRSYRPAFGIAAAGQQALGGTSLPAAGELPLEAVTWATASTMWNKCEGKNGQTAGQPPVDLTLRYTNSGRFDKGNNYVMADTSAKFYNTAATFNPQRFMWGKAAYSLGGSPVVDPVTKQPVQ
jgi:prepilin-type N-terminal cleavage/methylation domain-containing protein